MLCPGTDLGEMSDFRAKAKQAVAAAFILPVIAGSMVGFIVVSVEVLLP